MKYENIVPSISHKNLTQKTILLKSTFRKGISKITRLKTGHSMLKGYRNKIDTKTSPECSTWKVKLEKGIKKIFYKNNCPKVNITIEDLLGVCDLPSHEAVIVRKKMEEFILATAKEIQNQNMKIQ